MTSNRDSKDADTEVIDLRLISRRIVVKGDDSAVVVKDGVRSCGRRIVENDRSC